MRCQPHLEPLEPRYAPAGFVLKGTVAVYQGGSGFDEVVIENHNDQPCQVVLDWELLMTPGSDLNNPDRPLHTYIPLPDGTRMLRVSLGGGDDVFDNRTDLPSKVDGGPGMDVILSGDGNDTLIGGGHADLIFGGEGNDRITSGPGDDEIDGGGGNDVINAGAGDNFVTGGPGNDRITVGAGMNWIEGGEGRDYITVLGGGFTLAWDAVRPLGMGKGQWFNEET